MTLPHAWHTFLHPAPETLAPRTVRRAERMIVRQWERSEEAARRRGEEPPDDDQPAFEVDPGF